MTSNPPTVASRRALLVGFGCAALGRQAANATEPVRIAAAADLQVVLPKIVTAFERASGQSARVTYGATGNLARQIRQGAPFDVFLAADERFILDMVRDKVLPEAGPVYARGRLAIVAGRDGPLQAAILSADPLQALADAIRQGTAFRIAIANPEHAPYGQRAVEVLRKRNLYDLARPRLVYGENVAQATQFVATGAAATGIISHSTAGAPALVERLLAAPVAADLHAPLDQRLSVSARAGPPARAFAAFVMSAPAQTLFSAHGFDPPART